MSHDTWVIILVQHRSDQSRISHLPAQDRSWHRDHFCLYDEKLVQSSMMNAYTVCKLFYTMPKIGRRHASEYDNRPQPYTTKGFAGQTNVPKPSLSRRWSIRSNKTVRIPMVTGIGLICCCTKRSDFSLTREAERKVSTRLQNVFQRIFWRWYLGSGLNYYTIKCTSRFDGLRLWCA
jgi:hypothetical protein